MFLAHDAEEILKNSTNASRRCLGPLAWNYEKSGTWPQRLSCCFAGFSKHAEHCTNKYSHGQWPSDMGKILVNTGSTKNKNLRVEIGK
jgi:hypothetical protein